MNKSVRTRRRPADLRTTSTSSPDSVSRPNDPHEGLRLCIDYVDPQDLKPPSRKLRKSDSRQAAALRASVSEFGLLNAILIDDEQRIICGHGRWLAAKDLGLSKVPVIRVAHLNAEQKRLYAIAENRIGELGEWGEAELKLELAELSDLTINLDLNVDVTGFTTSEIDDLLVRPVPVEVGEEKETPRRHAPVIDPRFSYRGEDVVATLEKACRKIGYPRTIRVDNGSEFISRDMDLWAYQRGVILDFSRPGKPTDTDVVDKPYVG